MTCRHSPGDPNCSSNKYTPPSPPTPDAENYSVVKAERIGSHLVLMVKYPNCARCKFEGNKIMVFLFVNELDALKWKKIDPHFRDSKAKVRETEAPSPAARFPGSDNGWADALAYAKCKNSPPKVEERTDW